MGSGVGLIPEQAWELPDLARSPFGTDPTIASIGFRNGKPAGSASALTWSAGQFVRLTLDVGGAASVLDRPAYTFDRYVRHAQGETHADRDRAGRPRRRSATRSTVTGTTAPGNTSPWRPPTPTRASRRRTHSTTVGGRAAPSASTIPLTGGTTVLNIVATSPSGATGARRAHGRLRPARPGTLIFAADDPDGDDNGPGNYAYPTDRRLQAGRLRPAALRGLRRRRPDIVFRVRTRDLTPTFGSPLGAQLVDVYVHVPGAAATSTAAVVPAAQLRDRRGRRVEPR